MPETRSRLSDAFTSRAAGLLRMRWFVRAPIWLFRARMGFLFGSRLLMLEHTGRKTGAPRHVILEVIGRPRPETYVVASGFGARAQWYRNIQANPSVRVYIGGHGPAPATARPLTSDETSAVLDGYAQRHPRAWAAMSPVLENTLGAPVTGMPMIALELRQQA